MWDWWKRLTDIQRTQYSLAAFLLVAIFAFELTSGEKAEDSASLQAAVDVRQEVAMAPPDVPYEPTQVDRRLSPSSNDTHTQGVPPTAVVDGVTYTGEQQIEAFTQAARDAGLSEPDARRTGREAAILCNGNPDCIR